MQLRLGDMLGAYRVLAEQEVSGGATLLAAQHVETQASVVLRWLPVVPGRDATFMREGARRLMAIRHPNVGAVLSCEEHQGRMYLVREALHGETLAQRMQRGALEPVEACRILHAAMCGVAEAHAQGVLHGNLRPEDIILHETPGRPCVPKVVELWTGKLETDAARHQVHTLHSPAFGAYKYMAFEQLHAHEDIDGRADVYGLAAMLYRALTGKLPYLADNPVDLALAMAKEHLVPLEMHDSRFSLDLAHTLRGALSKDRERRYPTVGALAKAIEPFAFGTKSVVAAPATRLQQARKPQVELGKRWVRIEPSVRPRAAPLALPTQAPRWVWAGLLGGVLLGALGWALAC